MKQMERASRRELSGVVVVTLSFSVSFVLDRAILPDPARRAANDRRQPVNDLMTMSRDGAHPTRIDFGEQGGRQGLRAE